MGNIKHVTTVTPVEEILNILDEDAGVIIDDFLESADLAQIKKDLRPFLTVTNNGQDEFTGFETKRVGALLARSETCQNLALDPLINKLADGFLGPHCENYQLHFSSAIQIGPENRVKFFTEIGEFGEDIFQEKSKHNSVLSGQLMISLKKMEQHK